MACILSTNITIDCRESMGGIVEVYVSELSNVASYTTSSGVATITKAGGSRFWKYEQNQGAGSASAVFGGERALGGRFYTHTIALQFPKFEVSLRNEILALAAQRVVVITKDQNGEYMVYGINNGLMISEGTGQTGTAAADLNGFTITLTGDEKQLPYKVDSTAIAGLLTA